MTAFKANLLGFGVFLLAMGSIGWLSAKTAIPDYSNDAFLLVALAVALVSNLGLMGRFAVSLAETKTRSVLLFCLLVSGATALWWIVGVLLAVVVFFGTGGVLR